MKTAFIFPLLVATSISCAAPFTVTPGPGNDILWGSSMHPFIVSTWPKDTKGAIIAGKGNHFDHRYRIVLRIPIEQLIPKGTCNKATLEFKIKGFHGTLEQREFVLGVIPDDILLLAARELNSETEEVTKLTLGKQDLNKPIRIDVTKQLNQALYHVYSAITFRLQPVIEPNNDPTVSGAQLDPKSVKLIVE